MFEIKIKYFCNDLIKLEKIDKGDWIDLRASEDIVLMEGDFKYIPLGVAMQLPEGYEAHIAPRGSTFKNWGILQTNSIGIVDESFCGSDDQWHYAVYATRYTKIKKNDRIAQFRIIEKMHSIKFTEVESLSENNRGRDGSTGIN